MKIIGKKTKLEELTLTEKIVVTLLTVGAFIGIACDVSIIESYCARLKSNTYQETKIEMSLQKALELYNNR